MTLRVCSFSFARSLAAPNIKPVDEWGTQVGAPSGALLYYPLYTLSDHNEHIREMFSRSKHSTLLKKRKEKKRKEKKRKEKKRKEKKRKEKKRKEKKRKFCRKKVLSTLG
jgi:hypothetical protein